MKHLAFLFVLDIHCRQRLVATRADRFCGMELSPSVVSSDLAEQHAATAESAIPRFAAFDTASA